MSHSSKRIIAIIVAAAVVASGCAFMLDHHVLSETYARTPEKTASLLPTYELYEKDYPRTDVEFQLNGATLRGHVYGQDNTRGLIIFRHGMFSHQNDYLPMITAMVDKGWRVLAYDALGCGASDGDSMLGMSQSPLDVTAAVNYVQDNDLADGMPLVLWGHSWGGYGVAAALKSCPDVDACVTMSGFDTPMKVLDYSASSSFGPLGKLQYPFLWLNTYLAFGDNADVSASDAIVDSAVPTLVIQGAGDTTVPYNGVSIAGELEKRAPGIDNAAFEIQILTEPGRDGHNSYFYSRESQAYLNECAEALQNLIDENDNDAGAPAVQNYLSGVDLHRANMADPALVSAIDEFLERHAGK